MNENQNYVVLQNGYTISYDNDNCYINDKIVKPVENATQGKKEQAEELKSNFYSTFFRKYFKNIVVLTAAGTSLDNGDNGDSCGKTRDGLWEHCKHEITAFTNKITRLSEKECYKNKDIENFLSYIILYEKLNGKLVSEKENLKEKLEKKIAEACGLTLDDQPPHQNFLDKITARKPSDSRVKLFTTNYDTLFEQAANKAGFVIIDGFSFTQPREFSGRYFDYDIVHREKTRVKQEESFITKVFHLYKLHGSLIWEKDKNGHIIQKEEPENPLIIYPASEKYESSYEQPYFEMMSRFQSALRKENVLLIVIGFGFQDKHIQNAIIEAVEQNPSFQLVIVNYNNNNKIESTNLEPFFNDTKTMEVKRNVTIIFDKFKGFTKNYPENQTYIEPKKENHNESVQS